MPNELRHCPFCGGKAHTYHTQLWHVSCDNPSCCVVGFGAFLTEEEVIEAWNRRAKPAYVEVKMPKETQERIKQTVHDEVRDALKEIGIIRCKDCKYHKRFWSSSYCNHFSRVIKNPNGFCVWAKPRGEA